MSQKNKMQNILWYFTIFSIIGLIIETIYCYLTTGIWESRKGLIIGPFCPVYGLGASILILLLENWKKHKFLLFLLGAIAGNVIEYILSYIMEAVYGTRFWDYSYVTYHLNGRICITYSIYWGLLSVLLICYIKPMIDKILNKINNNIIKIGSILLFIFFIINAILTVWGICTYENRIKQQLMGIQKHENTNWFIKGKEYIEENIFSNEFMSKTFPNLRYKNEKGEEIWLRDYIQ